MKIIQQTNKTLKQMMGYTVVASSGKVLVIDGGHTGNGAELKRIIKSVGGYVNLWLITHPHSDHHNAVIEALDNPEGIEYALLGAGRLPEHWEDTLTEGRGDIPDLTAWREYEKKLDNRYFDIKAGQTFHLGTMKVEVLAGANPEITANPFNNQSCVFRVTENNFTMLFLGDLGVEAGKKLMATGIDLRADGCQLAHHGQGGVDEEFYRAVSPKYAFWSTPDWLWQNIPFTGGIPGTGPFKTQETAKWMSRLHTENIFSFDKTVMFDTETGKTAEY